MARDHVLPKKLSPDELARRKQIGVTLKRIRERKRLSIEACAAIAGVSYGTWGRWESGRTAIPLELVANICRALDQNVISVIAPHLRAA